MRLLIAIFSLSMTAGAAAVENQGIQTRPDIAVRAIPVCYDFACKNSALVDLSVTEWQEVAGWFRTVAATPEEERDQIKHAVGWMEVLVGRRTPTHRDLALNLPVEPEDLVGLFPGQQDCIDESSNTTTYLRLFEERGLLRHHTVIERAYRSAVWDQHWAGQIREIDSGNRYVVDSWFQPNGYLPIIQSSPDWENIVGLSAMTYNGPENDDDSPAQDDSAAAHDPCGDGCAGADSDLETRGGK